MKSLLLRCLKSEGTLFLLNISATSSDSVHSKWMLEVWLSDHSHFISKYVITNEKTKARMFVLLKQKLGVKHEMVGEI